MNPFWFAALLGKLSTNPRNYLISSGTHFSLNHWQFDYFRCTLVHISFFLSAVSMVLRMKKKKLRLHSDRAMMFVRVIKFYFDFGVINMLSIWYQWSENYTMQKQKNVKHHTYDFVMAAKRSIDLDSIGKKNERLLFIYSLTFGVLCFVRRFVCIET